MKHTPIVTAAGRHIRAEAKWTKCKGKHMRQVCHMCRLYKSGSCVVYKEHIDAWMLLQVSYKKEMT